MSAHAWYVAAAYGVSALALGGLIVVLIASAARSRRELARLEAAGVKRRSGGQS